MINFYARSVLSMSDQVFDFQIIVSISKTCIFATLVAPNRRSCAYNAVASASRAFLLGIGRQKEETEEPIHSK